MRWNIVGHILVFYFLIMSNSVFCQERLININFNGDLSDKINAYRIFTQFDQPDQVKGVEGQAWRTDGFSSWAEANIDLSGVEEVSISTWIAIESYPSDLETTVDKLSPSSIISQRLNLSGFDIYINTFGQWGLWLGDGESDVNIQAESAFPLYQWVHVAAVISNTKGFAALYLNGQQVASINKPNKHLFNAAPSALLLAKSHQDVRSLDFELNRLNAAYDLVDVKRGITLPAELIKEVKARNVSSVNIQESLVVPRSRLASDHLRPSYHAMPPANWTNEPHGLVRKDDDWHLFYQRTPNGPYKTQMHWGHMVSKDLITWAHYQDALWPSLQNDEFGFDMKGIWSGDVVVQDDLAYAFYTSVNHGDRLTHYNPGISLAVSRDADLLNWEKLGPIINSEHVSDFRDPYIWIDGNQWHMIIGAAYGESGGLDYYVMDKIGGVTHWRHQKHFSSVPYAQMDIGSAIWEMPVFEALSEDVHILLVNPIGGNIQKYQDPSTRGVYWLGKWKNGLFTPFYKTPKPLDILVGHLSPTVARADDGAIRAIGIVDERRTPSAQKNAGWAHTFSLVRRWFLMADGLTLGQEPAPENKALRKAKLFEQTAVVSTQETLLLKDKLAYELLLSDVNLGQEILTIELFANDDSTETTKLIFNSLTNTVVLDKTHSNLSGNDEGPLLITGAYDRVAHGDIQTINVFVDGSVVDVFINQSAAFSVRSYPSKMTSNQLKLVTSSGLIHIGKAEIWELSNDNDFISNESIVRAEAKY
ncbi:GH32 C-terminal domain-containing protein [Shewanella sp. A14]